MLVLVPLRPQHGPHPEGHDVAEYIDRCQQLRDEGVDGRREHQPFWGLGGGCYDIWLDDWREVYEGRLRIEFFEHVARDPQAVTEALCRWLGIDTGVCAGLRYGVENKTVQYKNKRIQQAALAVNRRGERFFADHPGLKRALRGAYYRVNSEASEERLEPRERDRLTAFYAPHNERLAVGLAACGVDDLPDWLRVPRHV